MKDEPKVGWNKGRMPGWIEGCIAGWIKGLNKDDFKDGLGKWRMNEKWIQIWIKGWVGDEFRDEPKDTFWMN